MERAALTAIGLLVIGVLAAGLTETALALNQRGFIAEVAPAVKSGPTPTSARPGVTATPQLTATPVPPAVPNVTPTPVPTPLPTPVPTVVVPGAVTNSFVHLRAGASTATPILTDLQAGTRVVLGSYRDSQWQEVTVNGYHGYVFRAYLQY